MCFFFIINSVPFWPRFWLHLRPYVLLCFFFKFDPLLALVLVAPEAICTLFASVLV